jgi:hypothetical protein
MALAFDLQSVTVTEFGVGRDEAEGQSFTLVPVDASVQTAPGGDGPRHVERHGGA